MDRPKILKAGDDPDCIHHEDISPSLIGTCRKCGQVKDYSRVRRKVDIVADGRGVANYHEMMQEKRSKGRRNRREVRSGT